MSNLCTRCFFFFFGTQFNLPPPLPFFVLNKFFFFFFFFFKFRTHYFLTFNCRCFVPILGITRIPETQQLGIVMTHLPEGDLRQWMQETLTSSGSSSSTHPDDIMKLSYLAICRKIYSISLGLSYIHERGICHRDLHAG